MPFPIDELLMRIQGLARPDIGDTTHGDLVDDTNTRNANPFEPPHIMPPLNFKDIPGSGQEGYFQRPSFQPVSDMQQEFPFVKQSDVPQPRIPQGLPPPNVPRGSLDLNQLPGIRGELAMRGLGGEMFARGGVPQMPNREVAPYDLRFGYRRSF